MSWNFSTVGQGFQTLLEGISGGVGKNEKPEQNTPAPISQTPLSDTTSNGVANVIANQQNQQNGNLMRYLMIGGAVLGVVGVSYLIFRK